MTSVVLRPWQPEDGAALSSIYRSTPDLATQIGGSILDTAEEAEQFIERNLVFESAVACNFALELDGEAIGNVGISNVNRSHDTAWMYYWVSRSARGSGMATRAAATLADWAFQELGIFRIELGHRVNNPASCRVAMRAGFLVEGVERAKLRYGDRRFDVETHARLLTDPKPGVSLMPVVAAGPPVT